MGRKRALSVTEALVAATLFGFGVVTACSDGSHSASSGNGADPGGRSNSSGSPELSGVVAGGVAAGSGAGSVLGRAGSSASNGGSTIGSGGALAGTGGSGEAAGMAGEQSVAGAPGSAGEPGAEAGSSSAGEGGMGGEPPYPRVHFPRENPDSEAKDMLGKILFWDEQVGSDNTMACGTCHRPGSGGGSDPRAVESTKWHPGDDGVFGTPDDIHGSQGIRYCTGGDGVTVSYLAAPAPSPFGLNHQVTARKAPTYLDAMFAGDIFWDGRATSQFIDPLSKVVAIQAGGALENQAVGPPLNPAEMACANRSFGSLLTKLASVTPLALAKTVPSAMKAAIEAANSRYVDLFSAAFPGATPPLSATHFAFAIATHERHMQSNQTPWDLYNQSLNDPKTGDPNALTPAQLHGLQLFMGKAGCKACHIPPLFSDFNLHFITEKDLGRQAIPGHSADPPGQVKTASLRNVGLREAQGLFHYGYGPGLSLDAVVAWYNIPPREMSAQEIQEDPLLVSITRLNLTADEIADLLDFLRNGLTDPRVKKQAFPFDRPTLSTE